MFREVFLIVLVGAIGYVVIDAQGTCNVGGHLYAHGESWYVNCTTLCHCDLTAVHHVSCKQPCLDFSTLPRECSLSPPLPGMCCPQPHCPPSVTIEIPPEYASQYPVVG